MKFRFAALAWALAVAMPCAAAGGRPEAGIKDPHYGEALFRFFQSQYFSSITSLMVSQHFLRLPHHGDEAEVLRGGLLLSYGMHKEAGQIFARLIQDHAAPAVQDRAWFFLAKIRYQRGLITEAEDAVARIKDQLPPDLEEERALLQTQLLMARGDYPGAAALLAKLSGASAAARGVAQYVRYNLGVALIRSGEIESGSALLDELGRAPAATEEQRALRDKANVALGFAALQDRRPEGARVVLERVRMNGMLANKALLGFGWAAAALNQHEQALVPWSELSHRDGGDAAVLEARIALPYAYAELGADGQALEHYQAALASFRREGAALDETVAAIRAGKLIAGLLENNPGEEMGWFWNIAKLPELPHASHMNQILAEHEFQEAFKNYRDLQFLARNLQNWSNSLSAFNDALAVRRRAYAERLPQALEGARSGKGALQQLSQRRQALAHELTRVRGDTDAAALADAKQRELLDRLEQVQATLQRLGEADQASAEGQALQERVRRVAGALTWELTQEYTARLWNAEKGLKAIDTELAQARAHESALAKAQREEPARFERFAGRIAALGQRIQALIPQVAALAREQQDQLQEMAVAELERQKERLAEYTEQAQFAVAQLYDRANFARKIDEAAKP